MPSTSQPSALCLEPSASEPQNVAHAADAGLRMDEASFRLFYEQSAPRLLGYLLRVSGDRAVAEDLLQETYCRFLSTKIPVMGEASQRSYLFRIATNLLRDRWRRHRDSAIRENVPEPASAPPQLDRQLELRQAFQQLKVRERQLLWLAYVEGSNHKEIAEVTGLRHGSIRLLLFRARRRLANLVRGVTSSETGSSK
jgi:RNA polymerase sigma-70 factor (ECF subfamily)